MKGAYKECIRIRTSYRAILSHLKVNIRRITCVRDKEGVWFAHYAGDVSSGSATSEAGASAGQVAHDLQHFYPGQHRETRLSLPRHDDGRVVPMRGVRFAFSLAWPPGLTGQILSVFLSPFLSREL